MSTEPDSKLFTPQKVATHEHLSKMPATRFLESHSGVWHIGARRESRYAKSNLLFSVYYVCKCNGKSLYRPYSKATETDSLPDGALKCSRCFKNEDAQ